MGGRFGLVFVNTFDGTISVAEFFDFKGSRRDLGLTGINPSVLIITCK